MPITAKLDTRPDRIDLRDREYKPPLRSLDPEFPSMEVVTVALPLYQQHNMVLNQGGEGACTGFGLAATINALLWRRELLTHDRSANLVVNPKGKPPPKVSTRMLYHLARFYDEWPGEDYEGSSCRGAIKAWYKHGVCSENLWPYRNQKTNRVEFVYPDPRWKTDAAGRPLGVYSRIDKDSITDMQAAIQEVGGIYCSASVHDGWDVAKKTGKVTHTSLPKIAWKPGIVIKGGHAFSLVGYNRKGFIVQNSWGDSWGQMGFAILSYADWLENGSDAWVCVLGAPKDIEMPGHYSSSSLFRERDSIRYNRDLSALIQSPSVFGKSEKPADSWSVQQAYQHSVVMGNDGKVINRLVDQQDGRAAVTKVVIDNPLEYFAEDSTRPPRILLYAHGGLNAEGDSLNRVQAMGPYLRSNGIYPLFFTWKTGLLESLYSILSDATQRMFPQRGGLIDFIEAAKKHLEDVLDRTLEVACENLGVKAIWSQMKQNAAAASRRENNDRGVFLTTLALKELQAQVAGLEIHLVGHSAGSILLGHMLDDFPRNGLKVKSCTLYAPACTVDFAVRHYQKAIETNHLLDLSDLHIHLLDDQRERNDSVGPYQKSLLYLVSRALEDHHKAPMLGLQNAFDAEKAKTGNDYNCWHPSTLAKLRKWQDFWGGRNLELIERDQVATAAKWQHGQITEVLQSIDAAHGSFDNDVQVVANTIRRTTGDNLLKKPVENLIYR